MNGKIALAITPKGIETVAFVQDKKAALEFYTLIQEEIRTFESRVLFIVRERELVMREVRNEKRN